MPEHLVMARNTGRDHEKWDSILVKPNNSPWGAEEIASENFRIIQIPDAGTTGNPDHEMSMVEAKSYLTAQPGFKDRSLPLGNKNLKMKARTFNIASFTPDQKDKLNGPRKVSRANNYDVEIMGDVFRAASFMKPIIPR